MSFEYVHMSSTEEAEEYYKEKGNWIVANVRQSVGWPDYKVIVYFRGVPLLFLPEENDAFPALAVLCKDEISEEKGRETIQHFLSSLAWSKQAVIEIEAWGGGSRPHVFGKPANVRVLSRPFRIMYLPDTLDPETRLALAFYREAMALEHPAYGFLSYYKIINLKHRTGGAQKNWIEQKLPSVTYWEGKNRLQELKKKFGSDREIAEYLYHSCRCAIAHADINQETVHPEEYEDMARLRSDLPLIRGLVELLIEEEFGVLSESTIHRNHPYELFGFRAILGEEMVKEIIDGNPVQDASFPETISIRLWGDKIHNSFERMKVGAVGIKEGGLIIEAISSNNMMAVILKLDFSKERVIFDPLASIRMVEDDGSISWAESNLDGCRFLRKYWTNGILEIWDPENNQCLGFSDAFVPMNIDLSSTIDNFDQRIKVYEEELERRKQAIVEEGDKAAKDSMKSEGR